MLLNSKYPDDIRVRKEASVLIANGYHVNLLCLRKKNQQSIEVIDNIRLHRINAGKNNYALAFWDIVMSLFFLHPIFFFKASRLIREFNISLVHVHDLPLVGTALKLKNKHPNIKVVFDMHENYPEALPIWFAWKKNIITRIKNRLFMNTERWLKWEGIAVNQCDSIITVVDEMAENLNFKYNGLSTKISVVMNSESTEFMSSESDQLIYREYPSKFIIAYVGGLGPHRGVDVAIEGMKFLKNENIALIIVGGGSIEAVNELEMQISNLGLENQVFIKGHQPFSRVYSFMKYADVNIIPHKINKQNDYGVPHKLFQSMMVGKPVLVSTCKPLKRIVETSNAGLVFESQNAMDFANKVKLLYYDQSLRNTLGRNGYVNSTTGHFSWEFSANNLLNTYKKLTT